MYGSVFIIGYDDFVVRGNGNVLNLKERKKFYYYVFIWFYYKVFFFFLLFKLVIFMDFLEGFVRIVKVKYFWIILN